MPTDFSQLDPALILVSVVALALAPFVAVMVTSSTKLVVVLSLLRNALGLQQVPPNVVINGLAIVLTIYVMYPVILQTNAAIEARTQGQPPPVATQSVDAAAPAPADAEVDASTPGTDTTQARSARGPLFENVVSGTEREAAAAAAQTDEAAQDEQAQLPPLPAKGVARLLALGDAGKEPLRAFLIKHSSDAERAFFLNSVKRLMPPDQRDTVSADDFIVVVPAFTVAELTEAFKIGFLIFLPFLIIDLVVANILLALGMMMMSPTVVSLPFKLLLFVLVDGWAKLVHGLVLTY